MADSRGAIKELEQMVQRQLGDVVHDIALALKECIEEEKFMTEESGYFILMENAGLVEPHKVDGTYDPSSKGRELYERLRRAGYYNIFV